MEWMVCNNCKVPAAGKQSAFTFTHCGHLFCSRCITQAKQKCPQCGVVGVNCLPLNKPLHQDIKSYFSPLTQQIAAFSKAIDFQSEQRTIAARFKLTKYAKYQALKQEYCRMSEELKKEMNECSTLKKECQILQKRQEELKIQLLRQSQTARAPNYFNNSIMNSTMTSKSSGQSQCSTFSHSEKKPNVHLVTPVSDSQFRVPMTSKVPKSVRSVTHTSTPNELMTPVPQSEYNENLRFVNKRPSPVNPQLQSDSYRSFFKRQKIPEINKKLQMSSGSYMSDGSLIPQTYSSSSDELDSVNMSNEKYQFNHIITPQISPRHIQRSHQMTPDTINSSGQYVRNTCSTMGPSEIRSKLADPFSNMRL